MHPGVFVRRKMTTIVLIIVSTVVIYHHSGSWMLASSELSEEARAEIEKIRSIMIPIPTKANMNETLDPSQAPQGQKLVELFKQKRNGTFIEAGGVDGVYFSNTYHLERAYGWRGVLIEPNEFHRDALIASGRDRSVFAPTCMSTEAWTTQHTITMVPFTAGQKNWALVGGYSGLAKWTLKRRIPNRRVKRMDCYPLQRIMEATGFTHVDLISLDIQGPEMHVLRSLDWTRVSMNVIEVERSYHGHSRVKELIEFLGSKGYREAYKVNGDMVFVREDFVI